MLGDSAGTTNVLDAVEGKCCIGAHQMQEMKSTEGVEDR